MVTVVLLDCVGSAKDVAVTVTVVAAARDAGGVALARDHAPRGIDFAGIMFRSLVALALKHECSSAPPGARSRDRVPRGRGFPE
jgi:hypothetical protein